MYESAPPLVHPLNVSLVSLNSQYVHSSLAVWYLHAALAQFAQTPHCCTVVEGTINEREDAVLERILAGRPDLLGFSCYIWNIKRVYALLTRVKAALPECRIVLGGPEVSYNAAELLLKYPEVDYIIAGEGEKPLVLLLDTLGGRGAPAEVPGLCFRDKAGLHLAEAFAHEKIAVSPFGPDYFSALQGRIAYIETSRGCPYSCAFCLSGRGEKVREVPLERAFAEILELARSGTQTIKFVDRTFNAKRLRSKQILRFLCEHYDVDIPRGLVFHFEIAGDLLDDETLSIVAQAPPGLFQFEIGLQSMHEETLHSVRRKTDMNVLRARVEQLIACGKAHVHLDLIAGLPHENLPLFAQSFDEAYALKAQALQLGFLKLIHGSAMRTEAELYPCRFDPQPPYEVRETPWLSAAELRDLHQVERAVDKLHNSGRFAGTLEYLTQRCGQSPFALFQRLGQVLVDTEARLNKTLSLEELTDLIFTSLCAWLPEQGPKLRDLLLIDRLASTATNFLPLSLRIKEAHFIEIKRALAQKYPRPEGTTRAVALLYPAEGKQVVFCDYKEKDPVTGLFPLQFLPLSELGFL